MNKFLQLGYYTSSLPESYYRKIKRKVGKKKEKELVIAVINAVYKEFNQNHRYVMTTKNLKLSRFIPLGKVIKMKLITCATVSAIVAVVLRKMGYPTKLIHGKLKKHNGQSYHAWIEVYLKEKGGFVPFDPSLNQYKITKNHKRLGAYVDWRELQEKRKNI